MYNADLEDAADLAIQERISLYMVAIDVSDDNPDWGTGSLIKYKDRFFIMTCAHVVTRNKSNDQIGVLFHPKGTVRSLRKGELENMSTSKLMSSEVKKSFGQKVEIKNRYYSDSDDLVLLELEQSSSHVSENEFYDLPEMGIMIPEPEQIIFCTGFSIELARDLGGKNFGVLPYSIATERSNVMIEHSSFNPDIHYLIDHPSEDSTEPKGLSGAAVWVRRPSGNGIWEPNLYLAGVQRAVFRRQNVLSIVKADRIVKLFEQIDK